MTITMEVAIALESLADDAGGERKKEGDIIVVRPIGEGIGETETKRYLWLRIEGLFNRAEYDVLALPIVVHDPIDPAIITEYDKRRYNIPLAKLQTFDATFDIDRARDSLDFYQPYMIIDQETFQYLTVDPPFNVSGLIFDKSTGTYI